MNFSLVFSCRLFMRNPFCLSASHVFRVFRVFRIAVIVATSIAVSVVTSILSVRPPSVLAQQQAPPKPETKRILGIKVEGNASIDEASIINLSGLVIGDEIPMGGAPSSRVAEALRSLWKRKQFTNVGIEIDRVTATGVYLKIKVAEASHVSSIEIIGNETASNKDLTKAADKNPGDLISDYDLNLIQKAIKQVYEKNGKQFVKVETTLTTPDSASPDRTKLGYKKLLIRIKESPAFYVSNVEFTGNNSFTQRELAGALENTQTKEWWQFWKSTKFDKKKYEKDKDGLVTFYRKNGFMDASLISDSLTYNEADETVAVRMRVEEGNRVYIRNINFEGNLVYPPEFLQFRLGFVKGDVYNVEKFDQNLNGNQEQSDVSALYMNNGYLTARMEKDDSKRIGTDSVDILVRVREGQQFTVRRVEIEGNIKTRDKVIRRELFTRPGSYFSRAAIIRGVRSLGQLNYFNPEKLRPDIKLADNSQVDVVYKVEERSADTFNASVGFAGAFGVTGSIGITLNNFSIGEPLAGGGGQIFNFNWEFGGRGSQLGQGFGAGGGFGFQSGLNTFNFGFTEPWLFDEPTTLGFNIFDQRQSQQFSGFGGFQQTGASINIGRRFRVPDDFFRGDWIIRGQYSETSGSSFFFVNGLDMSIQQSISRISIDNAIFPTDGSRFSLTTKWSLGALGIGQFDYLKNTLDFDVYTPLLQIADQNRLVLRITSSMNYVTGLRDDNSIPPLERYQLGGTALGGFGLTPLRGYPDRSIGPRQLSQTDNRRGSKDEFGNDLGGQPIGGQVMFTSAVELRFAVTLNPVPIYVIGFLEGGNVWDRLANVNPLDLKRSAGVGVRLLLNPIGLLGFDYGYGFDRVAPIGQDNGQPQFRFQFQFGR
jgi:outer membrane protein insertion porin family